MQLSLLYVKSCLPAKTIFTKPDPDKDGAILDGRDIGTIVCPNADFKLFIMAELEIRAKRRWKELLQSDPTVIYCEVLEEMRSRDERDTNREDAPLVVTSDAMVIDTSNKSIDVSFNEAKIGYCLDVFEPSVI